MIMASKVISLIIKVEDDSLATAFMVLQQVTIGSKCKIQKQTHRCLLLSLLL